jgi:UDP-N-acetyl-2-amino-2-deoxyglucuronate dehydrogenase
LRIREEIRVKYAIIGTGRISKNHINAARINHLDLVAVCDVNLFSIKKNFSESELYGIKIYNEFLEMLNKEELDIVAIATPSDMHPIIAKECILRGVNVIVEKPAALSLHQIDELISLSKVSNVRVIPCHQNRFNNVVARLKESIIKGSLGELYYGVAAIRWNRSEEYYSQDDWRGKWISDGGALMNQSIHNIDLLLWLMDSPVVEVFAYIDNKNHPNIEVEDMGFALLKFANGTYGIIESSMNTFPENFEETISIFGRNGSVVLGGKSVNKVVHWNVNNDSIMSSDSFNEEVENIYGNGHIRLYYDFINAIGSNINPSITLEDGRNAVEVILAIYKSSFEKRPVQLPLNNQIGTPMFEGMNIK